MKTWENCEDKTEATFVSSEDRFVESVRGLSWLEPQNIKKSSFKCTSNYIYEDIKDFNKEFTLQQAKNYYENVSFEDAFNLYEELRYRHYVVYYSALAAFENTKSKNIVECGVAEGQSIFFALLSFYVSNLVFKKINFINYSKALYWIVLIYGLVYIYISLFNFY